MTWEELYGSIAAGVRAEAEKIPACVVGAVRICSYPLCESADAWLGGHGNFDDDGMAIPDYELTLPLVDGGVTVSNNGGCMVSHYALTAMLVAAHSLAQHQAEAVSPEQLDLDGLPEANEHGGFIYNDGAVKAMEVNHINYMGGGRHKFSQPFFGLYVAVSSEATEDENDRIAAAGINAARGIIDKELNFEVAN